MRAAIAAICVFLGACFLWAQSGQGSIAGTILDRVGHKVASALIEAKNMNTGAAYAIQSDAQGAYALSLPSGTYEISAIVADHKYIQQGIVVTPDRPLRGIDVILAIP